MAKKPEQDAGQSGVNVSNGTVPTDRWRFICWLVGQLAKGGPMSLLLGLLLYFIYQFASTHLTNQVEILRELTANQATAAKLIEQKNATIEQNHQLLVASQARDDAAMGALRDAAMVQQEIVRTLESANRTMEPVPKMREKSLALQQDQLDQQREHGKLLEKLLMKLGNSPAVPNSGNGP
jgi:hypothetical protein